MDNIKKYSLISLFSLLFGVGISYLYLPPKIETKFEQIVKEVEVIKKDIVYVTKKITTPDGTVIEETRTEDKTVVESETNVVTKSETSTDNRKQWKIGITAGASPSDLKNKESILYGISIEKRYIGPFFVGGYYRPNSNNEIGVALSYEF